MDEETDTAAPDAPAAAPARPRKTEQPRNGGLTIIGARDDTDPTIEQSVEDEHVSQS